MRDEFRHLRELLEPGDGATQLEYLVMVLLLVAAMVAVVALVWMRAV